MPGQKRKRLTPGLSGFTKVVANDNVSGLDPLAAPSSSSFASAAFSCETPTLAPMLPPGPGAPKLYRFSPRLSASTGLFNSPMFSVQTPVFEYQSAPNVFHNSLLPPPFAAAAAAAAAAANGAGGGSAPTSSSAISTQSHAGLLSPIPFMESPYGFHQQQAPASQQAQAHPPRLSLTGTQPQNSVLERFRKFFDNQGGPADFGSPSIRAVTEPFSLGMAMQPPPPPKQDVPGPIGADDDDLSSGDSHDVLSPSASAELSESLLRSGSSCHQCKSRRMQGYLSFCSGAKAKRKSCRKKYCDACLTKFYHLQPSRNGTAREQTVWSCPSCRGICCCAACRRSKQQQQQQQQHQHQHQQGPFAKTPELYSPATSMAVGLVYFGDFDLLDGSVPMQLPPPAIATGPRPRDSLSFQPMQ